jgi:nicotinate-nucleotide--dimethylbenzimidazole phosphoribosyltransferase
MSRHALPASARAALYEVMRLRRDIREFEPGALVDEASLARILHAADLAPSVGFSQPWVFVRIGEAAIRARIRASFLRCREAEASRFAEPRRSKYLSYRLEGILESSFNLCVCVDLRNQGEHVLGTTAQPEAVRASVLCAVQNLWLAARAEGVAVGWVSIVEPEVLRAELALPPGIEPVAYLCVGLPKVPFADRPLLEETGWLPRRPLRVFLERWPADAAAPMPLGPIEPLVPAGAYACEPPCEAARRAATSHQANLLKPEGSLGKLEDLAAWVAACTRQFPVPRTSAGDVSTALALFAGDHGVTAHGVSAYGSQLTAAMLAAMARGGAAISVLARRHGVDLHLIDVGVRGALDAVPVRPLYPVHDARICEGTRDMLRGPALLPAEVDAALEVGMTWAKRLSTATVLAVGEVGIGNTTSAAAIVCALTGAAPREVVGRGTGVSSEVLDHKVLVVEQSLRRAGFGVSEVAHDPLRVLAEVGGLELAAMAGFIIGAAQCRRPVVLDGFLANAAALVAARLSGTELCGYLVASHRSAERGAIRALQALEMHPLLDLDLRLGEGTGAVFALNLIRDALALEERMATHQTAARP